MGRRRTWNTNNTRDMIQRAELPRGLEELLQRAAAHAGAGSRAEQAYRSAILSVGMRARADIILSQARAEVRRSKRKTHLAYAIALEALAVARVAVLWNIVTELLMHSYSDAPERVQVLRARQIVMLVEGARRAGGLCNLALEQNGKGKSRLQVADRALEATNDLISQASIWDLI